MSNSRRLPTFEEKMASLILGGVVLPKGIVKMEVLDPSTYLTEEGLSKALKDLKVIEVGLDKLSDDQKEKFEKAKKNLAKLTKKKVTDKNGKTTTVWVKSGESGGKGKRKAIKDADLKVGNSYNLPNGEVIKISRLFTENGDQDWVDFDRSGGSGQQGKNSSSVKQLRIFLNNWKAVAEESKEPVKNQKAKTLEDFELSEDKAISADAKKIQDWSYQQKWSDDDGTLKAQYEKNIAIFEKKHGVKVDIKGSTRIGKMVSGWEKEGRAFSHIKNVDSDFFEGIGVDSGSVGVTSITGGDLLYYDVDVYKNARDAVRGIKSKKEAGKSGDKKKDIVKKYKSGEKLSDEEVSLLPTPYKVAYKNKHTLRS